MSINEVKDYVVSKATDSIVSRFLRNAGIEDIINHPKRYRLELTFEDDGVTVKIKKKK